MRQMIWTLVSAFMVSAHCAATADSKAPTGPRSTSPTFVYRDFDRFAAAHSATAKGEDPLLAMTRYVDGATPAFRFYADRYDVTPEALARAIERRPKFYTRITRLKPRIRRQERIITAGLARLDRLAGKRADAPIHFLVASQVAGGTPVELNQAKPPALGIGIAVDMVSMDKDVDMSEFPAGVGGRASLSDVAYVAIHETVHVHQVKAQGGLDNYRSIYRPGPNSTNLAVAVREGCADYLTFLASGLRRSGDQAAYGMAHERQLWAEFQKIMNQPAFSAPGWFAGASERYPQWPSQIGYWLGGEMCRHYHQTSQNKQAAIRDMFAAYQPADVRKFADAYGRKFAD